MLRIEVSDEYITELTLYGCKAFRVRLRGGVCDVALLLNCSCTWFPVDGTENAVLGDSLESFQ
jgi:hypothetical protein